MLAVAGVLLVKAGSAAAWPTDMESWQYRDCFYVNGTTSDMAVYHNLTIPTNADGDCIDLVFKNGTGDDADNVSYFLEYNETGEFCMLWIFLENNITHCMYYGNSEASSVGDSDDIFLWFDDFEDYACSSNIDGQGNWSENNGLDNFVDCSIYYHGSKSLGHWGNTNDHYSQQNIGDQDSLVLVAYQRDNNTDARPQLSTRDDGSFYTFIKQETDGKWKYYNNGGQQDSSVAYSLDRWYRIVVNLTADEFGIQIWDTTDWSEDFYIAGETAGTYTDGMDAIELISPNVYGGGWWDFVFTTKNADPYPTLTFLGEEGNPGVDNTPVVIINEPLNTTYYTTAIQLNFTATDVEDLNTSCAVYVDGALNDTYEVDNATDEVLDFTLTGGQHWFRVNSTDSQGNSDVEDIYFYVMMGINVSAFDGGDNSTLTSWTLDVSNDTNTFYNSSAYNPYEIEWSDLPSGNVNITVGDGSDTLYFFNETLAWSINSSDYTSMNFYLTEKPSNSFSFISSPAWTVAENAAVTITCTATEGSAVLYKDGVVVSSPYEATMPFGMYNFTCTVAETDNYAPYTETKWLTVQSGGFGCTDTDTYAFNKNITVTGEWINIDFTDLVSSKKVKSDLSDVYITADFEVTTYKNTSGSSSYIVANFSNNTEIEVYFGNYIVNYTHNETATVANSTNMSGYSEINAYITASLIDEISGTYLLPPDANNSMTIYCTGGASTFDVYDTQFIVATTEEADSLRFTVQYSAAELYYRDYVIDAPIENQPIYLVDANDYQVVRQIYKLRDLTGEFIPSYFIVDKYMEGDLVTITELLFDTENKAIAFLTNGHKYLIFLDNGESVRGVGNIYVDSADLEKTITVGGVDAYNMTNANVTLNVTHTDTTILLYWYDASGQTNQVDLWVYNYTNRSHLLYYGAAASNDVLLSYVVPNSSATYWVEYEIHSDYYGNETVGGGMAMVFSYVLPAVSFPLLALLTAMGAQLPTLWFMLFFILPMPLFFTSRTVGVGALVMVGTAAIMLYWQQLSIYAPLLGLGLFMVVLIEVNARRKRERVR